MTSERLKGEGIEPPRSPASYNNETALESNCSIAPVSHHDPSVADTSVAARTVDEKGEHDPDDSW
jgi:hypothetical protein